MSQINIDSLILKDDCYLSSDSTPYTGSFIKYETNPKYLTFNKIIESGNLIDGKKEGIVIEYRPTEDGIHKIIVNYLNNQKHGKVIDFYPNGDIRSVYYFKHNIDHKRFISYDHFQNITLNVKYKNGVDKVGNLYHHGLLALKTTTFSNGNIKKRIEYTYNYFHEDSTSRVKGIYSKESIKILKNPVKREIKTYYKTGQIKSVKNYTNHKKSGEWTKYNEKGEKIFNKNYD